MRLFYIGFLAIGVVWGINAKSETLIHDNSDMLCGVISIAAAATILEREVDLTLLASDPRFITIGQGSSLAQLRDCASYLELHSIAVEGLTVDYFNHADCLIIVHVSKSGAPTTRFDHYELFIGWDGANPVFFDSDKGLYVSDTTSIGNRMSGYGLLLSKKPIAINSNNRPYHVWFVSTLTVCLLCGLTILFYIKCLFKNRKAIHSHSWKMIG